MSLKNLRRFEVVTSDGVKSSQDRFPDWEISAIVRGERSVPFNFIVRTSLDSM